MSLYRRANSPYWWSKVYIEGDPVAFSTRERHKVKALAVERDKLLEIQAKRKQVGQFTLATMGAKLVAWQLANHRRHLTTVATERILRHHVLPFFGADRDVRSIAAADLEAFKAARVASGAKANTVGQSLSVIRQVLRYCVEVHKLMPAAPTVRNPTHRYEPRWRLLTADEVRAILAELARADNRGREALPWALLVANTGMRMGRSGEVSQLTWDMVDLVAREIHLPGRVTKTGRARTVPLNDAAMAALEHQRAHGELGRVFRDRQHYQAWHRAVEDAGIVGRVRPYDLRHTFASMLHASGRPPVEVRDLLGHTTWSMVNHYAHSYREKLHEAVLTVEVSAAREPAPKRPGRNEGHPQSPRSTQFPPPVPGARCNVDKNVAEPGENVAIEASKGHLPAAAFEPHHRRGKRTSAK